MVGSQPRSALHGWYSVQRDWLGCFICLSPPSCPVSPVPVCHHFSIMGCSRLIEGKKGGRKLTISEHLSGASFWAQPWEEPRGSEPHKDVTIESMTHVVQSQSSGKERGSQ